MTEIITGKNEVESIQAEKFCETMEELINSQDFERAFEIVVDKSKKYNKTYILGILGKIKNKENLENKEKKDFLSFLKDKQIERITNKVYNRVKGLTIQESKQFLEKYPVEKILDSLVENSKKKFLETLKYKYKIDEEIEVKGEKFLKISKKDNNGNIKRGVIKENEKNKVEEKCIFDKVGTIENQNGKIYFYGMIGNKWGYIKLGEENKVKEKCIFDNILSLQEIDGENYYIGKIGDKRGYVKLGEEEKAKEKCIFDEIQGIQEVSGEVYFTGEIGDKKGYIKVGEEEKAKENFVFGNVGRIQEVDGKIFYYGVIGWGYDGYKTKCRIKYGDEDKANNILVTTDRVSELKKDEKGVYFEYSKLFLTKRKYIDKK